MNFLEKLNLVAKEFKELVKNKRIRIFSHIDSDGICSSSIIAKALLREDLNFELRGEKQLNKEVIDRIDFSEKDFFIFLDFGSGQANYLGKILEKCKVLILDHHEPVNFNHENLINLNPLIFGEEEVSTSIISFLFSRSLNETNKDIIDMGIVGEIGDKGYEILQFSPLVKKILKEAEDMGRIVIRNDLRAYGIYTRPIHKVLEYALNPFIPNVSGSESKAVQFLQELGISPKKDGDWITLKDLSEEEKKKLISAIIIERVREDYQNPEDIFGEVYLLPDKPEEIRDARDFSTLLNACGRLGNFHIGIGLCLNPLDYLEEAKGILTEYKKTISEILASIRSGNLVESRENSIYLLGGSFIPETLIGTIVSIFMNSIDLKKPIFGIVESENNLKVSARRPSNLNVNLRNLLIKAVEKIGGEAGGHPQAAGAFIPKGKEYEFMEVMDKLVGEELG